MTNRLAYLLYQLSVVFYVAVIHLAGWWKHKAKLMVDGRKNWKRNLNEQLKAIDKPIIWFHCASLGEFEMARPIIEHIRGKQKNAILITFFSPSGYEIRKNYNDADIIIYLPFDIGHQARDFVSLIKPTKAFFVKYELWLGYLAALNKNNVDTYLIGAHFRPNGVYFKWYGGIYRKALQALKLIFTQTQTDIVLLQKHHIHNGVCAGDPRYDRVWQNAQKKKENTAVANFVGNRVCIILGSSYTPEEQIAADALSTLPDHVCLIVAPHEVNETRIAEIESTFSAYPTIRYSAINKTAAVNKVLIIDNIGMLADTYQYAQFAFVGGGFGIKGLHNILEALAMGCYVMVGPRNHERFPEATEAIHAGVASVVDTHKLLISTISSLISITSSFVYLKEQSIQFVSKRSGASKTIIHKTGS
jgi:3-deoxy-D-manno-octulosonic-acid transferase